MIQCFVFLKLALPQCPPKLYHNSHLQVRVTNTKTEASLQPPKSQVLEPPHLTLTPVFRKFRVKNGRLLQGSTVSRTEWQTKEYRVWCWNWKTEQTGDV